jgi:7,8-dihydropterin-6-yl-methyl-4-(beta-D-ribofuranosyl)aminobenzene 5'-phosphate synthase
MRTLRTFAFALVTAFFLVSAPNSARATDRVTILYDAFSDSPQVTKDWGFSALIEHDGKRILFDTGNNAEIFEHNVKTLKVDLTKLDFVVISHRHTDHTSGLKYLLTVNPNVIVYVPANGANGFGGAELPPTFLRPETSLPANMRYFGGSYPAHLAAGKLYDKGDFRLIAKTTEVAPGIFLIFTVSDVPGMKELPELTLAWKGPNGLVLVDGCSHTGIEPILAAASTIDTHFWIVFGGLHLVSTPEQEIDHIVENLKTKWKLEKIAPGHCTGEPAFLRLKNAYGENYLYAGAGTTINVP